jgi:ribosome biogenesis GTPase
VTEGLTERAMVLQGTGGVWQVRTEAGETRSVSLRGRLKKETGDAIKLAVGDDVILGRDERDSTWAITGIEPRRSKLARRAPGGARGERVIAANIDQVIIVFAAANPEPHPRMLDRFLVIAEGNDLKARVIINKVDLVDLDETRERWSDYTRAGYPLHLTSVKRGDGLEEVRAVLAGQVSVLSGPSGVGKSSLMNTLFPGLNLRVGEISESVNKGRHTTVGAMLHPLPGGGAVVDTPGLREVGMWGLDPDALDVCFPELRPYLNNCRFRDCTHAVEPGCAVRAALEAGEVSRARWESYLKLRAELAGESPG